MGDPKDETIEEINEYLIENKFQSHQYSFMLVDSLSYLLSIERHALNTYKLENGGKPSAIQLRIYDNNDNFFNGYAQCYGPLKKLNILDSNPPRIIPHLPNNQNLKFEHEFELWEIDETTKQKIIAESKTHTYTFVLYWNIWTNYYSKVVFKEIEKYIEKHQAEDFSILYIIVNNAYDLDG